MNMNCTRILLLAVAFAGLAGAAAINQVAYASLAGIQLITFDDIAGGEAPGTSYNGIFESGDTSFGERFAGQTIGNVGGFDVLSGTPGRPLSLLVGAPGQNLAVLINDDSQVLTGLGPTGFPDFDAIGEGSFALLFDFDQSEFGFQLVGGNGGSATVSFFRRDGTLIETITLNGLSSTFYGFSREGAVKDVAGVSISNEDAAGIGFDNLLHDVAGIPGTPGADTPEPASFGLTSLT